MKACETVRYTPAMRAEVGRFLNAAYADLCALPPVGVEGPDYPEFTEAGLEAGEAQGAETLLAYDGGRLVSAASWHRADGEPRGVIDFVATIPAHRRKGCARRLLGACQESARGQAVERLQTGPFVDSRYEPACRLFEASGFEVREPDHMNTTWIIDIGRWTPREPPLPPGYRIVSFRPGDEVVWCELHRQVFRGSATPEWFMGRFGGLPNFEPNGWFFVEHDGRKVGMAGAIVWFHDPELQRPSGALVEWVGVLEEERRKRLGEAVMVACLNYLKRRAVEPNCIVTQYARQPAVELYKKLGYRFVRECRTYVKALR
ncbi:MAG: GNAT family N-acetyltransferase [Armatimonadetes bacterium]|nr:GNAT family N-acetyltransferase [Armatimonadota bacterium]